MRSDVEFLRGRHVHYFVSASTAVNYFKINIHEFNSLSYIIHLMAQYFQQQSINLIYIMYFYEIHILIDCSRIFIEYIVLDLVLDHADLNTHYLHSFILNIYIEPLQENYSEVLPTPARLPCPHYNVKIMFYMTNSGLSSVLVFSTIANNFPLIIMQICLSLNIQAPTSVCAQEDRN